MSDQPLDRVLGALTLHGGREPRRSGQGWVARCPAHDDKEPSLSITDRSDGAVLLKCFAGCTTEQVVAALGLNLRDLFGEGGATPRVHRATAQPLGCTLAEYASTKRLPADFLRGLAVAEVRYLGATVLRIPYFSATGEESSVQLRVALAKNGDGTDNRFRWRKGSRAILYGLDRLQPARERGYVLLVEGASCAQTAWFHGYPAVGLPGANTWQEERDAEHLDGIETVYVIVEPDTGGEAVMDWVGRSAISSRVRLVELPTNDLSDLHVDDPDAFGDRLEQALREATPWSEVERLRRERAHRSAADKCRHLARQPHILDRFAREIGTTVSGEQEAVKLLYLCLTSRLLDRPISAVVKGPSSGGKSYLVEQVLRFIPSMGYELMTAMSEHALVYLEQELSHRFLVVYEASGLTGDFASYVMRSLLSEGRIRYPTVDKESGKLKARMIEIEGPTGLLVTTTALHLHPENETRLVSISVTDTAEQTAKVMRAIAERAPDPGTAEEWTALQEWVGFDVPMIVIPYAVELAQMIPPVAVRLRRDFRVLLGLIEAHALLHRASREIDDTGRLVATIEDYEVVRDIVGPFLTAGLEATVPDSIRETVAAVKALLEPDDVDEVMVKTIATQLKIDKSAAARRVRGCIDLGYLCNREDKRGRPSRIALGEPLPDDLEVLPTAERLHGCTVDAGGAAPPPPGPDTEADFIAAIDAEVAAGVLFDAAGLTMVRELIEPVPVGANGVAYCRDPAHRPSDWIGAGGKAICGICHPRADR